MPNNKNVSLVYGGSFVGYLQRDNCEGAWPKKAVWLLHESRLKSNWKSYHSGLCLYNWRCLHLWDWSTTLGWRWFLRWWKQQCYVRIWWRRLLSTSCQTRQMGLVLQWLWMLNGKGLNLNLSIVLFPFWKDCLFLCNHEIE